MFAVIFCGDSGGSHVHGAFFGGEAFRDARLGGDDDSIADGDMPDDAGLTGEDDVVADARASGDAGLGDDKAVFSDLDVVRNLDEVIDFRSLPMTVLPKRARSMVVFAPISTSFSTMTIPRWGILVCLPSIFSKPNPSPPMTVPEWRMTRSRISQR